MFRSVADVKNGSPILPAIESDDDLPPVSSYILLSGFTKSSQCPRLVVSLMGYPLLLISLRDPPLPLTVELNLQVPRHLRQGMRHLPRFMLTRTLKKNSKLLPFFPNSLITTPVLHLELMSTLTLVFVSWWNPALTPSWCPSTKIFHISRELDISYGACVADFQAL